MKLLKCSLLTVLFAASVAKADPQSVHGMLLFGKNVTYVSHLPMFHAPHDYQVILKINLQDLPPSQAVIAYEAAKSSGAALFTLVPEALDLAKVIAGVKTSFMAEIFQGHFEQGGQILGTVKVGITAIIYAKKLESAPVQSAFQSYVAFGDGGENFAVHLIKGKPNFDSVVAVSAPEHQCRRRFCPELAGQGDTQILLDKRSNSTLLFPEVGMALATQSADTITEVQHIIYLEQSDLAN